MTSRALRPAAMEMSARRASIIPNSSSRAAHGTKVFASWGLPLVPGFDQAHVKLTPDGTLEVKAGIHTIGQGLETTLAQIAHEQTGVPFKDIRVVLGDTANTPFSTGAYSSRGIVMSGGAVLRAAEVVARRIKAIAGHLLQVDADMVAFADGRILAGNASVSYADVGCAWYIRPDQLPESVDTGGLETTEGYKPLVDSGLYSYATHAARVAVDPETGIVEILDYVVVEDCGKMVNPMIVEGQTYGGAAQGIGTALFEESPYDNNGQPLASTLLDYILPGPTELPKFRIEHRESLSPYSAHGIKGSAKAERSRLPRLSRTRSTTRWRRSTPSSGRYRQARNEFVMQSGVRIASGRANPRRQQNEAGLV